jgi:hypothetical protein
MANVLTQIKNYVFPVATPEIKAFNDNKEDQKKDLSHYISRVQLQRYRTDVLMWRNAIGETEQAYYPQRVKMQRIYIDTVLNGHVSACMQRRKRLTTLREYLLCDEKDVENEKVTEIFKNQWFSASLEYIIDALGYGYSLMGFGDLINDEFPNLQLIKRWNVSPERTNVTAMIYSTSGVDFLKEPFVDWHLWIPTPSKNGISNCGYGYLYEVAQYEIMMRNLMGFNGDFVEMFSQPYRVARTQKTEGAERDMLESSLKNMGSSGYAIVDPGDEISFLETKLGGTGWQGYSNLEERCQKIVSKIILGHADALDSVPGKLGSEQGGDESPVSQALSEIQTEDGRFVENIVNNQLIPKLKNLGFNIPDGIKFKFKNDDEVEEFRRREDASNLETANIALLMKNANMQMDSKYFSDRTGIPCEVIPIPTTPPKQSPADLEKANKIKNKLNSLYSKKVK